MASTAPLFPGFHRVLFGRPPVSELEKMGRERGRVERLCLDQLGALFGTFLPAGPLAFKSRSGDNSRRRIYTPTVTFWGFLGQVLVPGSSCRKAVGNIQTLFATRGMPLPSSGTKAYCDARRRLPVRFLHRVVAHISERLCAGVAGGRGRGGRTLVVDGSALSMPDTRENQAKYPQHRQKPGCGFPLMKIVGLFCLESGAWIATAKSHHRVHESRLFARLLGRLRRGDTLVTDRGFCSYWAVSALMSRGASFVMRNNQKRKVDFRKGKRLGKGDHVITWHKPRCRAAWMSKARYDALPEQITLRETRLPAPEKKGFRTSTVTVVSSFTTVGEKSVGELAEYFARRWRVELYFDDTKTSGAMDVLRTKSPELICRELLMHMIAYNLVKAAAMAGCATANAKGAKAALDRVSYKGTADRIATWSATIWSAPGGRKAAEMVAHMHDTIGEDLVPERPGRREPRVVKRRAKNYQLMTKPRGEMVEIQHRNVYRKPA